MPAAAAHKRALPCSSQLSPGFSSNAATGPLKFDLLGLDIDTLHQEYNEVLITAIRTCELTGSSLDTLIRYVRILRLRSPELAHTALKLLITDRTLDLGQPGWHERVLVVMIWNLTISKIANRDVLLQEVLDVLDQHGGCILSTVPTHASQMLIWKSIEASLSSGDLTIAQSWCQLALHKIFNRTGEMNTAKLQRKLIICALASADYIKVRTVYADMATAAATAPETQRLMFMLAVLSGDTELAITCLNSVVRLTAKDATTLYSRIVEAQQSADQDQAISALQLVLVKYNYDSPPGAHVPALLRCTARLLISNLNREVGSESPYIDSTCKLFEAVTFQFIASRYGLANQSFAMAELDWFSRTSYNLALNSYSHWNPSQTLRLLKASLGLLDLFPQDMGPIQSADVAVRRSQCSFLTVTLLVLLAREEEVLEKQLHFYLELREHASRFNALLRAQMLPPIGSSKEDLACKCFTVLTYNFEAAVRLKAWDDVGSLLRNKLMPLDSSILGILGGLILSSDAPSAVIITVFQDIVNTAWQVEGYDMVKLSKWTRCLFQLALGTDSQVAKRVLDQTAAMISNETAKLYPKEELKWLVITAFNRTVDFYCNSQDADCKHWVRSALHLAKLSEDGGALFEMLQTKLVGLSWDK